MIATNIQQSQHLLELGLDPKTANMWWSTRFVYWNPTPMIGISTEQHQLYIFKWCEMDVPAWSLSALLKMMKEYCPELLFLEAYWFCRCDRVESEYCDDPITAVYDVLCWLLEHRLIEKEEQDGQ